MAGAVWSILTIRILDLFRISGFVLRIFDAGNHEWGLNPPQRTAKGAGEN
jgi:hypothetical protein